MAVCLTVKCQKNKRIFYCPVNETELKVGDPCIVVANKGQVLCRLIQGPKAMEKVPSSNAGRLVRKATEDDLRHYRRNRELEARAYHICQQKIKERKLPMKLVEVEYLFDRSKAIFYFTAEGRVDFRELVRDLAYELRTRIEMKQIGVRDEAKLLGGYGSCGRPLCCATFLESFEPVSIRMAKAQNLTLDPAKISGVCGRLMCCLEYEYEVYEQLRKKMPKVNEKVVYNGETCKVKSLDVLSETVYVEFPDGRVLKVKAGELKRRRQGVGRN